MENWKLIFRSSSPYVRGGWVGIFLCLLTACGEITNTASPTGSISKLAGSFLVVLGANFQDPVGTLSLLSSKKPRTVTPNVQSTHSDAVVRSFGNLFYVVNRLGADNIEVVDPSQNFKVLQQFSTGRGTNPQEIIVTSPSKAYVTLLQPDDNKSSDLSVNDLLIVNPSKGSILSSIDLTPLTANDGDRNARAAGMVLIGNLLYIALQDLPADLALPADQPGKIAIIDTTTDTLAGSITLTGRDPVDMKYSADTGLIYLSDADYFDTSSTKGGIEVVDPASKTTQGILVDDLALGGAPGDFESFKGKGDSPKGYTTVGAFDAKTGQFATKVVSFNLNSIATSPLITVYQGKAFIQDLLIDNSGNLVIGDRDPSVNGLLFIDTNTNAVVDGPVNTGPSPSSLALVNF